MKRTRVEINQDKLQVSSEILRALAHPLRIKILGFIDQHDELNVNKIYNTLRLEQSITSQHLRIMRNAGIVHAKRDGKYMYYSINYDKIEQVVHAVNRFLAQAEQES
ncbi:MAG TPA: metalloregulator ArsR/SmtB family transcription factor [Saprospiraceae bacterium]|nr:metalloregulator ArsR/SmtB family transcription factor [Saprospiraceae bacterium]